MKISIQGYNINYKITGEGEQTLVILQGWGTKLEVYDSVAASVNHKYRVVQFDFPGFRDRSAGGHAVVLAAVVVKVQRNRCSSDLQCLCERCYQLSIPFPPLLIDPV